MGVLILPLMLLNTLGGLVSGIWLAVGGRWDFVIFGLGISFVGVWLVHILQLPALALIAPVAIAGERGQRSPVFVGILAVIGIGYTFFIMGLWAIAAFYLYCNSLQPSLMIPGVLWSYATATGTWGYLAQRERDNENTAISALFHQFSSVALIVYVLTHFGQLRVPEMIVWYSAPMVVALVIETWIAVAYAARAARLHRQRGF